MSHGQNPVIKRLHLHVTEHTLACSSLDKILQVPSSPFFNFPHSGDPPWNTPQVLHGYLPWQALSMQCICNRGPDCGSRSSMFSPSPQTIPDWVWDVFLLCCCCFFLGALPNNLADLRAAYLCRFFHLSRPFSSADIISMLSISSSTSLS